MPWLKLVGGLRWDVYSAQFGNSINSANTVGNTAVPYQFQTDYFTSVRAGAIFEPTKEQSYYVSYSTSFNPSLEQLTSTTGSQSLPPENNEGYEAGVKYEFMNGNLSLNGALFQITKYNARTQNADGTFTPTGTVRVQGARVGAAGRITPEWQVFAGYAYLNARIIQGITNINGIGNTTGNVPLNTPKDSGNIWTTYTDQGHLRDRRRHVLCRPALRQQPEHRAGAGVFPLRPDGRLQAADLGTARQRLQPVQHDVLRPR